MLCWLQDRGPGDSNAIGIKGLLGMRYDGKTRVYGLFGDPVEHSLSPILQNAAFDAVRLNCCYLPFKVSAKNLSAAVQAIQSLSIAGVNVTAPHKETIVPFLDELSEEAQLLGAVNTVTDEQGVLRGYNTDLGGFSFLLERNLQPTGRREYVCLFGAGGAAKAVALSLARRPLEKLAIINRTLSKAEQLAEMLVKKRLLSAEQLMILPLRSPVLEPFVKRSTLLINALSADPLELGCLTALQPPPGSFFIDLRYNPPLTSFLAWAREGGEKGVNGLDMLLGQGAKAFEIFTGLRAPVSSMQKALQAALI